MKNKLIKIIPLCLALVILLPLVKIAGAAAVYTGTYQPVLAMYSIGYDSGLKGSETYYIKTRHQLEYFYGQNKVRYSLETNRQSGKKYEVGNFLEYIAKYDDKWFEKNDLAIVKTMAGSSMIYYRLKDVEYKDFTAIITITIDAPNRVSADMAGCFIFVEFKKQSGISDATVNFV